MVPNIKIRKTLASDLDQILALVRVANSRNPAMEALYPPEARRDAMFYSRHGFYLEHPEWHQCLTAVLAPSQGDGEKKEEVVGYCVGNRPKKWVEIGEDGVKNEMERKDWKLETPEVEGAKTEFFVWLLERMKENARSNDIEYLWGILPSFHSRPVLFTPHARLCSTLPNNSALLTPHRTRGPLRLSVAPANGDRLPAPRCLA